MTDNIHDTTAICTNSGSVSSHVDIKSLRQLLKSIPRPVKEQIIVGTDEHRRKLYEHLHSLPGYDPCFDGPHR